MYQVTLFDIDGAILYQEKFQYWTGAMTFMIDTATANINITTTTGRNLKFKATHWELTRLPVPDQAMKIGQVKSRSQARRLAYQRGDRY